MTVLMILGGVVALGVGIYLGLPGDSNVSREDIEEALSKPRSGHKKVKRRFTPLDYFARNKRESSIRNQERQRFKTVKGRKR